MQLFFNKTINLTKKQFTFNKDESKHIAKVLRKQKGDIIYITNGKGELFKVELAIVDVKKCSVLILDHKLISKPNYQLHIGIAPTKMNDRFEWFLEKATEIGVSSITPILCHNSERKIIKLERFNRVVVAAMKQSLQCYLPIINPLTPFKDFIKTNTASYKFIAHCKDTDKPLLQSQIKPNANYTIIIGPEGDFNNKEIELALQHKYTPISLGNTRLRTETAGIVACHTFALTHQLNIN